MITVSIEEYVGQVFDKFYAECEFKDAEISRKLMALLDELEVRVQEMVSQEHTSEMEEARDEGWRQGYEEGEVYGYEEGFVDGYDKAIEDHEIDA